jgi:hypothetical protein
MSQRYVPYALSEVPIQAFYGGQSSDEAIGTPASFSYSRAIEHRRNPSQLTVLPGPRKISAGVVNDLIMNMVQSADGNRYAMGDQGNVYKIDTANKVTYLNKFPTGSDGMLYRSDSDAIYFATKTDLRRYYPLSNNPTFDQTYAQSRSTDTRAYRTGGAAIYTIPLAVDESQLTSFQSDIEPFYSVKVNVLTKGTGDLLLTLHDGLNNVLATVTILNANVTTGLNEFVFATQIRGLVKPNARTYHFHVTSTIADTTMAVATAGSANTADFELWAYRFVNTINNYHPMAQFQQFTLIGNGNYLAVWEPLTDANPPNNEFQRHRLVFPSGYEVCGIAVTDEFAVIACGKFSTNGTKDFQSGKLFIWDGIAQTYNQIVDVSGGSPDAIQSKENYPYFFVNGTLCTWPGGKNIIKVRTIANVDTTYKNVVDNTHAHPNMMCIRDNLLHAGYPSYTTNVAIQHGVYIWGTLEKNFPESFNYGYVASAHQNNVLNTSGNLQLGCVRSFGDEMYMSWKDSNGAYGLDILDAFCTPAPIAQFRARRFDAGGVFRDKQAIKLSLITAPIPAGVTINSVYKVDNGSFIANAPMLTNDVENVAVVKNGIFKRLVYGFDIVNTGSVSPTVFCETLQYNPMIDRRAL